MVAQRQNEKGGYILAGFFVLMGLAYAGFVTYRFSDWIGEVREWEPRRAEIVSSGVETGTRHVERISRRHEAPMADQPRRRITVHQAAILYEYTYDGEIYENDDVFIGPQWGKRAIAERYVKAYRPGMETRCYVNPRDPERSVLVRGWRWHNVWYYAPSAILLGVGLFVLAFVKFSIDDDGWKEV